MTDRQNDSNKSSSIWGGRFSEGPSKVMERINNSIDFDKKMYSQDIRASKAHTSMLINQKIITKNDGEKIIQGLNQIYREISEGSFKFREDLEDIHMNIESRLSEIIGDAAGRLHTARSRNDQVATDFKLWVRDDLDSLDHALKIFQSVLISQSENHAATVLPGYTHLQTAQPVTLGHHLMAYVEMIGRDRGRINDCRKRMNENPLGSGALAGTSFNINRHQTTADLDFDRPTTNSLDAVSDRDFAMEYLSIASIISIHLSRLAEELVLWSSAAFKFINLPDSFSTGSSMLPQKRNPDAAELIRAKSGTIIGNLTNLFIVMKGLPLAYSKDMQEDKVPVFETSETLELTIAAMSGMIQELTFNKEKMKEAAKATHTNAIDFADWLVKNLNKPFREAHTISGRLVKLAESKDCSLEELTLSEMQDIEPKITNDALKVLELTVALDARTSFGGTAPKNVAEACKQARLKYL